MLIKVLAAFGILLGIITLTLWLVSYAVNKEDKEERDMEEDIGSSEAIYRELFLVVKSSNNRLEAENDKLKRELDIAERTIKAADIKRGMILQSYGEEQTE